MVHPRRLWSRLWQAGKKRKLKEIDKLWRASPNACPPFFWNGLHRQSLGKGDWLAVALFPIITERIKRCKI